jgi:hypothetical protein
MTFMMVAAIFGAVGMLAGNIFILSVIVPFFGMLAILSAMNPDKFFTALVYIRALSKIPFNALALSPYVRNCSKIRINLNNNDTNGARFLNWRDVRNSLKVLQLMSKLNERDFKKIIEGIGTFYDSSEFLKTFNDMVNFNITRSEEELQTMVAELIKRDKDG